MDNRKRAMAHDRTIPERRTYAARWRAGNRYSKPKQKDAFFRLEPKEKSYFPVLKPKQDLSFWGATHTPLPRKNFGNIFPHEWLYPFYIAISFNQCLRKFHTLKVWSILKTFKKYSWYIPKMMRIYPSVEFGRSRDNGRKLKHNNGVVMLEDHCNIDKSTL